MIFWDSSAVVPLLIAEPATGPARQLLEVDPAMIVWWSTPVECLSAIARSEHGKRLSSDAADQARQVLSVLAAAWSEVLAGEEVREHAGRLLLRHRLRAADALQLAAALTWARARPRRHGIATLDGSLAAAARGEGFSLALAIP
jgi:predicted nucleic acid-binding protein